MTKKPTTEEEQRVARVVGVLNELLATLPSASMQLWMSPEEIARREQRCLELHAEMHRIAWPDK